MGRPSKGFEAQEQIVAQIHSLPTSRFVVDIIKITTGARKMGNTILCPGKLASVYELQCGVGTERWIDEDFSRVGCIA